MGNRVETQDRLLAATRQIIINEGIEATSLEHICSVAGFTRGAFYSNFSSKDSLLGILAEAEYSDLIQRLRERVLLWENAQTPASRNDDGDRHLLMENLLFEALDAIHIDQGLYILHSEMLMRSIRDAECASSTSTASSPINSARSSTRFSPPQVENSPSPSALSPKA